MIKCVNKHVLEVTNSENPYFDKIIIFADKKTEKAIFAIAFSAARRVIIIAYSTNSHNSFNFTNFLCISWNSLCNFVNCIFPSPEIHFPVL